MMDFINYLRNRKSSFPAPEEARDKAKACELLSRDIYKDSTRFVYELLQNADDASCRNKSLYFQIDYIDDYLVISHKGKPFSESDIESICSIGDGMKSADADQTGFKGIGFKSVFAHAELVIIKSGGYCFKFDKEASNVWDAEWGDKSEWEQKRKSNGKDTDYSLPWQVIPINTEIPPAISALPVFEDGSFTVITILKCKKINTLKEAINDLFSKAQLILFLRSENVTIKVNGGQELFIEKKICDGITTVLKNGSIISQWLIKTSAPFEVPEDIKNAMSEDKDHYPEKLREATKTSMSFAVAIKNGRLTTIEDDYLNIFAFLPTSITKYKLPFIVNANFVTDAGRQNLHEDYVWNQWLFREMPKHYIQWMAELAKENSYGLDYLNIIALSAGENDILAKIYDEAMQEALATIAILQSSSGELLLIKDAVLDLTRISDFLSKDIILEYINDEGTNFTQHSFLPSKYRIIADRLRYLGVQIFGFEVLTTFMKSPIFLAHHQVSENAQLINFLRSLYPDAKSNVNELKNLTFIFSNHNTLVNPTAVCIPSTDFSSEYSDELDYINESVYQSLSQETINWLMQLGVTEPTDVSIISTRKVFQDGFITSNNAIGILQYIFGLHKKEKLNYSNYDDLKSILVLTTKGTLMPASNTYMSDDYRPALPLEKYVDIDFFISKAYIDWRGSVGEWSTFLEKIGVKHDLSIKHYYISFWEAYQSNYVDKDYIEDLGNYCRRFKWISAVVKDIGNKWSTTYTGNGSYGFTPQEISFNIVPYLNLASNYVFSKTLWDHLLSKYKDNPSELFSDELSVNGLTGPWYTRNLNGRYLKQEGFETSYMRWMLNNRGVIPASDHRCHLAKDVFANTIPNSQLIAGPYLPVIDVDMPNQSWITLLGLKTSFSIEDCLAVLTSISQDDESINENKPRISAIYEKLVELGALSSFEKDKIITWSRTHKILSKDDEFVSPSELSHITLDGFRSQNQVYIGNPHNRAKVIELLSLMGVTVITEHRIKPVFESMVEKTELKEVLKNKLSALALVSVDQKADQKEYYEQREALADRLERTHFYHCEKIKLTYGKANDVIEKTTFGKKNEFYYTGDLRPANIEPLLTPLCNYLGIKGKERELFVMLIEDMEGVRQNLKEKGYDTSLLEEQVVSESGDLVIRLPYNPSQSEQDRNAITGFKGEIIVYEMLKSQGYNPMCPSISTVNDYTHKVVVNNRIYYCKKNFDKYDISYKTIDGRQVYVEVKSTTTGVGQIENMPISSSEWSMIDECSDQSGKIYLLVRVFGIDRPEQDVYIFKASSDINTFN